MLIFAGSVIAYYTVSLVMSLVGVQLDVMGVVFWVRNMPYLGLVPQAIGISILVYYAYSRSFSVNQSKVRRELKTFCVGLILFLLAAISIVGTIPFVKANTVATTTYYLDTPLPIADFYIGNYSNGVYFAINGSNWDNFQTSTNYTALESICASTLTGGALYLGNVPWNYSITVPSGVVVEEHYNGAVKRYINSANSQGSPYTVSTDGTNYYCQDSAFSYVNSFTSTNATIAVQNVVDSVSSSTSARILFREGRYSGIKNIFVGNSNIIFEGVARSATDQSGVVLISDSDDDSPMFYTNSTLKQFYLGWQHITFYGSSSAADVGSFIQLLNVDNSYVEDCSFYGSDNYAIELDKSYFNSLSNLDFTNNGGAILLDNSIDGNTANCNSFQGLNIGSITGSVGIDVTGAASLSFRDLWFQSVNCSIAMHFLSDDVNSKGPNNIFIEDLVVVDSPYPTYGVYLEGTATNPIKNIEFLSPSFGLKDTTGIGIDAVYSESVTVHNPQCAETGKTLMRAGTGCLNWCVVGTADVADSLVSGYTDGANAAEIKFVGPEYQQSGLATISNAAYIATGLGSAPTSAQVSVLYDNVIFASVATWNATHIRVYLYNVATNTTASGSHSVCWSAEYQPT